MRTFQIKSHRNSVHLKKSSEVTLMKKNTAESRTFEKMNKNEKIENGSSKHTEIDYTLFSPRWPI